MLFWRPETAKLQYTQSVRIIFYGTSAHGKIMFCLLRGLQFSLPFADESSSFSWRKAIVILLWKERLMSACRLILLNFKSLRESSAFCVNGFFPRRLGCATSTEIYQSGVRSFGWEQ